MDELKNAIIRLGLWRFEFSRIGGLRFGEIVSPLLGDIIFPAMDDPFRVAKSGYGRHAVMTHGRGRGSPTLSLAWCAF